MSILSGELTLYEALDSIEAEPCKMPKQKEFITCPKPYVAYVGGEGSGKTASLVTDCYLNAMAEPDGVTLVGRLNMTALEGSTMRSFLEMVPDSKGWQESKKIFTCSNRHDIVFKHLDISDPKVVGHIKSMNLSRAYIDEASEVNQETFQLVVGRCRRKSTKKHTVKIASNPAGHDWMWRTFFDPERKENIRKLTHGITASSFDNQFLSKEYLENRIALYPPDWADRFIYGHFSDFSDLVYKEFGEDSHVWDCYKGHEIFGGRTGPPENWSVIVGIDVGSDIDPWACVLVAVSPDGRLFQFAEVYGNSLLIRDIATELHMKLGDRPVDGMAYDYANRTAAVELAEHDIHGSPAIKEIRPGLFKTAQYMHVDPRMEHPFNGKIKGSPRFFVSSDCLNTRRELSSYKWAKDRSGVATGEPGHENSHSPDAVRYALHTFRPLPERLKPPKAWENPNLNAISRQYWKDAEQFVDKRDRLEKFKVRERTPKTLKEWMGVAARQGLRFQKPGYARYSRLAH
jgi:Phage terminase large subunit